MARAVGLEAAAKLVVVVSALLSVAVDLVLGSGAVRALPVYGGTAFALAFGVGRVWPRPVAFGLLATCYVAPAVMGLAFGHYVAPYYGIWLAALLGLILSTSTWASWHLDRPLGVVLGLWALTIAIGWPIVALREYDFAQGIAAWGPPSSGSGMFPGATVLWIASTASIALVSLLFVDWVFGRYAGERAERYTSDVILPLAVGSGISVAVALYQATVDINFLNGGVFPSVGRASGTMRDANPYGVVTALWGPAGVALIASLRGRPPAWAIAGVLFLSWCGFWVSGSRNALAAGAVGLAIVFWAQWRELSGRARSALLLSAAAVLVLAVAFATTIGDRVTSPVARVKQTFSVPPPTLTGMTAFLKRVWDPYSYGFVSGRMIQDVPIFGVGVGAFNVVVRDYAVAVDHPQVASDNAQNWFRHQLAELGLVGGIGWMGWTLILAYFIVAGRPQPWAKRSVSGIVRWLPGIFALVSLVGMPAMNASATITFWVLACWYLLLLDRSSLAGVLPSVRPRLMWAGVWAVALVFAAGTAVHAKTDLRVPNRALRFGWPYSYGFFDGHRPSRQTFDRMGRRAVAVFQTHGPYLKLTFWAEHEDLTSRPLPVRIWRGTERIGNLTLSGPSRVIWYVRAPPDRDWMMLEFEVGRTWSTESGGNQRSPEFGLSMANWEFVDSPPPGSAVVN